MRRLNSSRLRIHPLQVALEEVMSNNDYTIVQLGAYVGDTANDPMFSTIKQSSSQGLQIGNGRCQIILVEPVKQYFDELRQNYSDVHGVHFENVAVASESGKATLYQLGVDPIDHGYPEWLSQLSSLKEERISQLVNDDIKRFYMNHRVAHEVDCIKFDTLVERYSLTKIDLLQIDIEGYEYDLLRTIDFDSLPIRFINYESEVMFGNKLKCERLLRSKGYCTMDYAQDTFCFGRSDRQLIKRGVRGRSFSRRS